MSTREERRADVELRLPADGAYAAVLRTTAAGLAARLDFTLDDIEDLRMAAGEATALVLEQASRGGDLVAGFHLGSGSMTMTLSVQADHPSEPDYDSFAWQVLSTLASRAEAAVSPDRLSVSLTMESLLEAGGPQVAPQVAPGP
jgi:serine/threonine-protein kinase RsbW